MGDDTITVLDTVKTTHRIRLSGVDAPEKKQPFGGVSKQTLSDMVYERTVTIECDKYDPSGRKVGKVQMNGLNANLAQVHGKRAANPC